MDRLFIGTDHADRPWTVYRDEPRSNDPAGAAPSDGQRGATEEELQEARRGVATLTPAAVADRLRHLGQVQARQAREHSAALCERAAELLLALLQQLSAAQAPQPVVAPAVMEALTRLYWWGGLSAEMGYSTDVVTGVRNWIDGGMAEGLPPLPAWIADRCPPLLPPAAEGEVGGLVALVGIAAGICDHEGYHDEAVACRRAAALIQQQGSDSDGYHTLAELYEHRYSLMLALMRAVPNLCWFSQRHSDGGLPFDSGEWFIVGADFPTGSITYHLPIAMLELAQQTGAAELTTGRPWDGHNADDVSQRLRQWAALPLPSEEATNG